MLDWFLTLPARLTAAAIAAGALTIVLFLGFAVFRYGGNNPGVFSGWADVVVGKFFQFFGWLMGQLEQLG